MLVTVHKTCIMFFFIILTFIYLVHTYIDIKKKILYTLYVFTFSTYTLYCMQMLYQVK